MPEGPWPAPIARRYEFFGRIVGIETDAEEIAVTLDAVYERQRTSPDREPDVLVSVLAGAADGPRVTVGRRSIRVPDPSELVHYGHLVLVNVAASAADERVVLHGGATVVGRGAAILVGSSGWGKTTLTMELVRRGYGFLSDDFAVLRPDGVVEPFPRRVNLTDRSAALLGLTPAPHELRLNGFGGLAKWMVDVESLFPGRLSGAAPLFAVFLLSRDQTEADYYDPRRDLPLRHLGQVEAEGAVSHDDHPWQLELDHTPAGFVSALEALPGVAAVDVSPGQGHSVHVTLHPLGSGACTPGSPSVIRGLDQVCSAWNVTVLSAFRERAEPPAFSGPASGDEIEPSSAVPTLLAHSLGLAGRRFLYGTDDSVVMAALFRLRRTIESSGARVFRLVPGDLTATADMVVRLSAQGKP